MEIAIVGGGPKGLFAVERLLARHRGGPLGVTVFDPARPGTGSGYGCDQPEWLRLNVSADIVDAGWRQGCHPSPEWLISFDQWRSNTEDRFPARAEVGRYLDWVWRQLVRHAPSGVRLRHEPRWVCDLEPVRTGWSVAGQVVDEVLLTTGHASTWQGALQQGWRGCEQLVDRVYPVAGLASISPGASVAVRGSALTFIDAALALTQGRGGTFSGTDRLAYRRSGSEPAVIWPTARSGRWMEVKPDPRSPLAAASRVVCLERAAELLVAVESLDELRVMVGSIARDLLDSVGGADSDAVHDLLSGDADGDPTALLRRSWEVATGLRRPGATWAVGLAWRTLQPALASRFSGVAADPAFAGFTALTRRLERVAFGPPPVNAAKLLALVDASVIDPSSLQSAAVTSEGFCWHGGGPGADVVIDAVLAPPGVVPGSGDLAETAVTRGLVAVVSGRRGLAITADGNCLDAHGSSRDGLSALGRVTEDVTIGNDTLNRQHHGVDDRWAERVLEGANR